MKVYYKHYRIPVEVEVGKRGRPLELYLRHYTRGQGDFVPRAHGGATFCSIYNDKGFLVTYGKSHCSLSDNFCYREGRREAYKKAMERLVETVKKMVPSLRELVGEDLAESIFALGHFGVRLCDLSKEEKEK